MLLMYIAASMAIFGVIVSVSVASKVNYEVRHRYIDSAPAGGEVTLVTFTGKIFSVFVE